jgi:hypothetical protein
MPALLSHRAPPAGWNQAFLWKFQRRSEPWGAPEGLLRASLWPSKAFVFWEAFTPFTKVRQQRLSASPATLLEFLPYQPYTVRSWPTVA